MPTGTGYYSASERYYTTKGVETWADYVTWNDFVEWAGTPSNTLQWTGDIIDIGRSETVFPIVNCVTSIPFSHTIYYGDSVDSTGGAIDSPASVTYTPETASVVAIKARYFQIQIDIDRADTIGVDSVAQGLEPSITSVSFELSAETNTLTLDSIDTSTLTGSVGSRTLSLSGISSVKTCLVQPLINSVEDSAGQPNSPVVYVDKSVTPPLLNIFDIDAYGKRTRIDCVCDIQLQTFPSYKINELGNTEGNI